MITQTPSSNKTTPTERREPLRWLIPAALLLLFLSICCIGQVVIVILSPRNEASNLNLLSKDMADYSPWEQLLKFPPIAPGAAAAQAADRATEMAQSLLSPTPLALAQVPTSEVIVIAEPQNAPTTTPGSALVTPLPTVTPRPAALGPTETPVIGIVPPVPTSVPTLVAIVPPPTETPRPPTLTQTPVSNGSQPTRTNTPAPATTTNSPEPIDTSTPANVGRTPTREPPADTNTPVPPPADTDTPVPPPADTDTPVPPPADTDTPVPPPHNNTDTPVPPPTRTLTPVPPTRTPTPVPPTATHTLTPVPPTATNTPTATDTPTATNTPTATSTSTPTNTPTATPLPSCVAVGGTLTIAKIASNYTPNVGQDISYTICITNATGAQVLIKDIQDSLPNEWFWGSPSCSFTAVPSRSDLACSPPGSVNGWSVSWGNPTLGQPVMLNPGDRIDLIITGSYQGAGALPGQQKCNRVGSDYNVTLWDNSVRPGNNDACVVLQ